MARNGLVQFSCHTTTGQSLSEPVVAHHGQLPGPSALLCSPSRLVSIEPRSSCRALPRCAQTPTITPGLFGTPKEFPLQEGSCRHQIPRSTIYCPNDTTTTRLFSVNRGNLESYNQATPCFTTLPFGVVLAVRNHALYQATFVFRCKAIKSLLIRGVHAFYTLRLSFLLAWLGRLFCISIFNLHGRGTCCSKSHALLFFPSPSRFVN